MEEKLDYRNTWLGKSRNGNMRFFLCYRSECLTDKSKEATRKQQGFDRQEKEVCF